MNKGYLVVSSELRGLDTSQKFDETGKEELKDFVHLTEKAFATVFVDTSNVHLISFGQRADKCLILLAEKDFKFKSAIIINGPGRI